MSKIRLLIIVPTFNESQNIGECLCRIEKTLGASGWETIFVDDDSPDQTAKVVRDIARVDSRVRCLQRIGRRELSSAVIEGMMAASATIIAVMDADLQHDEAIFPKMISEIKENKADLVVAPRFGAGRSIGGWDKSRKKIIRIATLSSQVLINHDVSDPMSGFFMLNRQALDSVVHNLSGLGFKISLDILVTGKNHLRVSEVHYRFRGRHAGESKLDGRAAWEYGMLLADKTVGRFIPVRSLTFSIIGGLGVFVHMGVLALILKVLGLSFITGRFIATGTAMVFNFTINNILTYRDRRLTGWAWLAGLF